MIDETEMNVLSKFFEVDSVPIGFYFGEKGGSTGEPKPTATYDFIGVVEDWNNGVATVEMRNRFYEGEELEILSPGESFACRFTVRGMRDRAGEPCADAKRVQEIYTFDCPYPLAEGDILRRRGKK